MVNFLRKIFIKDYQKVNDNKVREAHGKLASFVGVFSNLFLFAIKMIAGIISGSIAIIADSINNLSDMGSSVITLVGFKLANAPADEEHPYGHQRIEYISGLIVAIIIIYVGGSLLVTSIKKIFNYEPTIVDNSVLYITIAILVVSIFIKLWQSIFNKKVGKIINSLALEATAADSRNDSISTAVILLGTIALLIFKDIPFSLDGVMGIFVSLFILISGIKLIKETMDPLIGVTQEHEFVQEILNFIELIAQKLDEKQAIIALQTGLSLLNKNRKDCIIEAKNALKEDGIYGEKTKASLCEACKNYNSRVIKKYILFVFSYNNWRISRFYYIR